MPTEERGGRPTRTGAGSRPYKPAGAIDLDTPATPIRVTIPARGRATPAASGGRLSIANPAKRLQGVGGAPAASDGRKGWGNVEWKLEVVVVPVSDVDRAKRFYGEQCGFVVDLDSGFPNGMRVVQLTPPGSACSITIGVGLSDSAPGSLQGLQLVVSDIEAARAMLVERGVEVSEVFHFADGVRRAGHGGAWNAFLAFSDPDGNGWVVQERPAGD